MDRQTFKAHSRGEIRNTHSWVSGEGQMPAVVGVWAVAVTVNTNTIPANSFPLRHAGVGPFKSSAGNY